MLLKGTVIGLLFVIQVFDAKTHWPLANRYFTIYDKMVLKIFINTIAICKTSSKKVNWEVAHVLALQVSATLINNSKQW